MRSFITYRFFLFLIVLEKSLQSPHVVCHSDLSCSKTMYHGGVTIHFLTARGFRAFLKRLGLGDISTIILLFFPQSKVTRTDDTLQNSFGFE